MKDRKAMAGLLAAVLATLPSCKGEDPLPQTQQQLGIDLKEFAIILSSVPMGKAQYDEVYDAVNCSVSNGYDEEYMLCDLFSDPGAGVGLKDGTRATGSYTEPLRDLIAEYVKSMGTRAGDAGLNPESYLESLGSSDMQIYWPYSDSWDGETAPIITFDPGDDSETSKGYRMVRRNGKTELEVLLVSEATAKKEPVWVINRNSDSSHTTLELLRREHPDWETGGGSVVIGKTKAGEDEEGGAKIKTLILKEFKARRPYDTWLAGASEFFVKCGSVEDFSASTEAELQLYNPSITDFMVVVRRNQVGESIPFNAVLVSQWTEQLHSCAFMISEDDGGTMTSWKCSGEVKIKSRTYGFDVNLPIRTRDDVVWRGQLAAPYLEKTSGQTGNFGDVELTFELVEY